MSCPAPSELEDVVAGSTSATAPIWTHLVDCEACCDELARRARAVTIATVGDHVYTLGRELARGGMGRVMLGRDVVLDRDVAIKLALSTQHDDPRFRREIELTARLQHPNIIPVYDTGTLDGAAFYAMRPVSGQRLDERIADASTREQRLLLLPHVIAVVDAIAYAHEQGVIHRDLKPANVLVGAHGETVVIDWGLGKTIGAADEAPGGDRVVGDAAATVAGSVIGTPGYLAPEQARGHTTDERTDVFALGCILFETLTGTRAYPGSPEAAITRVTAGGPVDLHTGAAREIPPELATIIAKATAISPSERYAHAGDLGADLRRYQAGLLVRAHRYRFRERAARFVRRHKIILAALAAALVSASVIGGIAIGRIVEARDRAETERRSAEDLLAYLVDTLPTKLRTVGKLDVLAEPAEQLDAYYTRVAPARPGSADELARLAAVRSLRAGIASRAGDAARASELSDDALALARRAVEEGVPAAHVTLARLLVDRGVAAMNLDENARAEEELRQALDALGALLPTPDVQRLRASTLARLAGLAFMGGRSAEGYAFDAQARALLGTPAADDVHAQQLLLAIDDAETGHAVFTRNLPLARQRAERLVETALAFQRNAPWIPDSHAGVASAHAQLASVLDELGEPAAAAAAFEQALEVSRTLCELEPSRVDWQQLLVARLIDYAAIRDAMTPDGGAAPRAEAVRRLAPLIEGPSPNPTLVQLAVYLQRTLDTPASRTRAAELAERLPEPIRTCTRVTLARDRAASALDANDRAAAIAALDEADRWFAGLPTDRPPCAQFVDFELALQRAATVPAQRAAAIARATALADAYIAAGVDAAIADTLRAKLAEAAAPP